jgi:glycosyltransferase involved in cell wall biosynthesis
MKSMKSVHLSLIEHGGAWNAARRIVDSINSVGGNAELLGLSGGGISKPVKLKTLFKIDQVIGEVAQSTTSVSLVRGFSSPGWIRNLDTRFPKTEIWNIHWMPGHMNRGFLDFLRSKNVVWTMHDMNPFTSVCHYSSTCNSYVDYCEKCPQVPEFLQPVVPLILNQKKQSYGALNNLSMVSPSKWLLNKCKESKIGRELKISHIPNPVPMREFEKRRDANNPTITILGNTYRKSKNSTIAALGILRLKREFPKLKFNLQIVGESFPELSKFKQICLPHESNEEDTIRFLEQSDILLYTSKSDNLPNFVLEAQAAGNTIVAFNEGGIPECFIPNVSGYLVGESEDEIATALHDIISGNKKLLNSSHAAREFVAINNSYKAIGEKYTSLYEELSS